MLSTHSHDVNTIDSINCSYSINITLKTIDMQFNRMAKVLTVAHAQVRIDLQITAKKRFLRVFQG